jgi:hypothetical protein
MNTTVGTRIIPSPLVGEGQGGEDCSTSNSGLPPTPNPSPPGGGDRAHNGARP